MCWVHEPRVQLRPALGADPDDAHAVVGLGDGRFVDLSRRQFHPEAEIFTRYASSAELGRHRAWIQTDNEWRGRAPWRSLNERRDGLPVLNLLETGPGAATSYLRRRPWPTPR